MDVDKAELRSRLERALRRPIPQAAWDKYDRDGWIEDFYKKELDHRGEKANFRALKVAFAKELEYLDQIEQEKVQAAVEEHETQLAEDVLPDQNLQAESQYFEVELGDYERERQRAFAEVMAREASKNEQVVSFRRDYLGGSVLTPDQAYAFLESPAARYFAAELFLEDLQISAAEHRAEIVGRYEQVRDAPNDVDHRVTVRVYPPGVTRRVRYARPSRPVTDGDQIDVRHCVFKGTKREVMQTPDEVLLRYRGRDGLRDVAYIWPGSMLDGLRYSGSRLAQTYSWKESDAVWFLLTGEAPNLTALTLNVRFTAGNLTIIMTAAPWVSLETIKKNFQKAQSQVLIKGNHALSLRSIAVLRFVERNIRERVKLPHWRELLDRWNEEHPEWQYQDYRGFRQNYYRTLDAVAYAPVRMPKWRLFPAQEKRTREALERAKEIVEVDRKRGDNKRSEI